jgi:hypothetical protein
MNIHITGQTGLNTFLSAIEGDINKNEDSLLYTTALYHIPKYQIMKSPGRTEKGG